MNIQNLVGQVPLDPYARQARQLQDASGRNPLMSGAEAIYSAVTGRSLYSQPLQVKNIQNTDQIYDTALGRYLVDGNGNQTLLMEAPPDDKQRFAVMGYSQAADGSVQQYVARIPPNRFAQPKVIGGISMPAKAVVSNGEYLGDRKKSRR